MFQRGMTAFRTYLLEKVLFKDSIDRMYLILGGHIYFQTLVAAVRLGVFDILAARKKMTQKELSDQLGIQQQPCRILLLGLTSLKLLKKRGEAYSNTKSAEIYLVSSSPQCIKNIVLWQSLINYKAMPYFYDSILKNTNTGLVEFPGHGNTLYERLSSDSHLENVFQLAMEEISRQANRQLIQNVDFSSIKFAVDIGGGTGENILKIAEKYPHLKGGVFDSPSVAARAEENFKRHGYERKLSAFPGNCFTDPLPAGPDCFILCHFLTIWSLKKNETLIRKVHQSLASGGKLLIFNMMQDNDRTGPLSASMGSPYFLTLATGEGMLYTWNEYIEILKRAGFSKIEVKKLPMDHGLILAEKT